MKSAMSPLPSVALIAGPTASGKSALAMALARQLHAAGREALIVNADASGVYRDIPILSAQPGRADLADVRHALVGHIDAAENCNAARWVDEARAAIDAATAQGIIPIIAGGTGLYIKTLLEGIAPVPDIPPEVRGAVRTLSAREAHARLAMLDPAAADRLRPTDTTRVQRALEVVLGTGKPLGQWQQHNVGGIGHRIALTPMLLLPPRAWLNARCDARLETMFAAGAVEEAQTLLKRKLDPSLPAMNAIGVPQIADWLTGEFAPDHGTAWPLAASQLATRQFAKRQYTFFRGQFPAPWARHDQELNDSAIDEIAIILRDRLLTG
ncbi:MAG: tRNA (adenosine(37)-N6)-dimethylallyltransferase MiaA [Sphingopyxis sp.]|nr:tRNA (adenosine(37)-N6)-dimethylallyltransferase MiaA [Sphingopyxis sp.]